MVRHACGYVGPMPSTYLIGLLAVATCPECRSTVAASAFVPVDGALEGEVVPKPTRRVLVAAMGRINGVMKDYGLRVAQTQEADGR